MITSTTLENDNIQAFKNSNIHTIQALKNDNIYTRLDVMIFECRGLFCTDQDRNRVTWETPSSEPIPCCRKPLRCTRLLRNPAQTQVWSEQVWLNTTFISQGSRSWDKLAVET